MFATHQARSSLCASDPVLLSFLLSPFFSVDCALPLITDISQLFVYQSLPHSFAFDGGCTPSLFRVPPFPRAFALSSFPSYSCVLFCTILHFFALTKNSTLLFSADSALFARKREALTRWFPYLRLCASSDSVAIRFSEAPLLA